MNSLFVNVLFTLSGVTIACFSQLLLKIEATKEHPTFLSQYLNLRVILAYFMLLISTMISLVTFRVIPLGFAPIAEAVAQILTVIISVVFLKEKVTKRKLLGLAVIVVGIVVMSF